jgi:hypothetical protein
LEWLDQLLQRWFPPPPLYLHPREELPSVAGYHARLNRDGYLRDIHQIIEVGSVVEHEMTLEHLWQSYERHREVCEKCRTSTSNGHCVVGKFYFSRIYDVRRCSRWRRA